MMNHFEKSKIFSTLKDIFAVDHKKDIIRFISISELGCTVGSGCNPLLVIIFTMNIIKVSTFSPRLIWNYKEKNYGSTAEFGFCK